MSYSKKILSLILLFFFSLNIKAQSKLTARPFKNIISFTTQNSVKLQVSFRDIPVLNSKYVVRIEESKTGKVIFDQIVAPDISSGNTVLFYINDLAVDTWWPTAPNLYKLTFTATQNDKKLEETQRIGFRFFESKNGNLYLNNKPIFLRGIAINPPDRGIPDSIEKSRKFAEDYVHFMKSIHVNIIRIPDDSTWYNVCDELGMMVFGGNYSGAVDGEKPPTDYDKAIRWYEEEKFAPIAHHPSLMVYAMTNEVDFAGKRAVLWENFLSYAAPKLKHWDSTRAYIANAGYGYGKSGDICDLHRYWGWYYNSPFSFLHIRYNEDIIPFKKKVQPVTFTECVGNYTGPDGRYNLTPNHKNPGSQLNWTGHASDDDQARLADEHQSLTFKEATELFRRLRNINTELSGVFPFTILFHNWNNVQQFVDMDPKAVTNQIKLSYNPILLSLENWKTQVYAGSMLTPIIHVVNDADDFSDLINAKLVYQLKDNGGELVSTDTINLPSIAYYATWQKSISIKLPEQMVMGTYQLTGKIFKNGKLVSENHDQIFIADKSWQTTARKFYAKIMLYDPAGTTGSSFDKLSIQYKKIISFKNIEPNSLLVIGENGADNEIKNQSLIIKQFIKAGGRVICLKQDENHLPFANNILSVPVKNISMNLDTAVYPPPPRPSRNGYYINPERPDHAVFAGINREQLKVWSDYTDWDESKTGFPAIYPVTDGYVPVNKKDIEHIAVLGNYGVALEGISLAEINSGKGSVLLCGLDLAGRTELDPVADRMLINMINYMSNGQQHELYPLITEPIVWGNYASEKGVLTGVNSGLMVHAVPLIPANVKSKITVTEDGNCFLGAPGGFNTRPGIQYVAHGRRMYGPYILRGFGNIPEPVDTSNNIGEGYFWCSIPSGKTMSSTLVWNQANEALVVKIKVNDGAEISKEIKAGETINVDCPVKVTTIKMEFIGDRRLVLLQTSFK